MERKMIFTIGHSTRSIEEFIRILNEYKITTLVDIRSIPRSSKNPQFNQDEMSTVLPKSGIQYIHLKELGGLRHPHKDSLNAGWRNPSFRGYADHMQSSEFETGLNRLIEIAKENVVAIMCSEAVPWKCHRSLVSDALLVYGFEAVDILTESKSQKHVLTAWARVEGKRITYPQEDKK